MFCAHKFILISTYDLCFCFLINFVLHRLVCSIAVTKCEVPMDLVLAVETSQNMGTRDFGLLKNTLWTLING